jgi:hypothetical protein
MKNADIGNCIFDSPTEFLPFCAHKLINLRDMIYWSAFNFGKHQIWIEREREKAKRAITETNRAGQVFGIEDGRVIGERAEIYKCLEGCLTKCDEIGLSATRTQAFKLMVLAGNPHKPFHWTEVDSGLEGIQWAIEEEISMRKFAFIPLDKVQYFERDGNGALFGKEVYKKFKAARLDIKSAGNCLAADENTAAVFHLMCVVNIGLIALAKHLKLKIKAIEYQEWKNIIDGLKKKVDLINQSPKGKKKQSDLEFHNGLLLECSGFKDVYRNNVAHARTHYGFNEAEGVHDRVRDFMRRLATRVSES